MALIALNNDKEKTEYFDHPDVLDFKVGKLAELIR